MERVCYQCHFQLQQTLPGVPGATNEKGGSTVVSNVICCGFDVRELSLQFKPTLTVQPKAVDVIQVGSMQSTLPQANE